MPNQLSLKTDYTRSWCSALPPATQTSKSVQRQLIHAGCHHIHQNLLPGHYLTARTKVKSRAPCGRIMAPTGLNMFPSKLANRS